MSDDAKGLVLVTGGSGFLAAHCIAKCLIANYRVRTTLRSLKREAEVREMVKVAEATNLDRLTFVEADLLKDDNWAEAVKGCTFVLHVASPFPAATPKNEDDLIIPAREGTLRVLRASRDAGVKRIVVTSSVAAIDEQKQKRGPDVPFTEKDWSELDTPGISPYMKSKTIAERAAWDFIEKEGRDLEMSVVNPVSVFGPVLSTDFSTSCQIVLRLLNGSMPGCPDLYWNVVDARDVADLHLLAMTDPKAKGERFIASAPPGLKTKDLSLALRKELGKKARKAPTMALPNIMLKAIALFDPAVAQVVPMLGNVKPVSIDKAKDILGWRPRSNIESAVATAESLIRFGVLKV